MEDGLGGLQSHGPQGGVLGEGLGKQWLQRLAQTNKMPLSQKEREEVLAPCRRLSGLGPWPKWEGHSCVLCMSASSLISSFPSFPARPSFLPLDITAFAWWRSPAST